MARNTRRFREERGLSMGELARRAGLSKQTLSKVEQGTGNPTVETLALLSTALDVSPRRLLTEWGTPVFVQRQTDDVWTGTADHAERLLDQLYGSGYVRNQVLRFRRGAAPVVAAPHPTGALLHLYVITGRVRTGPLRDPVDLAAGDFVRFPGDVPHQHLCLTERAVVHLVTTLPGVPQFEPVPHPSS
ncbi:XRE family transcriptional regulator [Klenkia sp. LSe6-5]|uniref:XRE family transcriptional regulator n=1 Tax=Klenkia sesuvii TaxID=3103137 RepID=A0ABU8DR94_9ACTN